LNVIHICIRDSQISIDQELPFVHAFLTFNQCVGNSIIFLMVDSFLVHINVITSTE